MTKVSKKIAAVFMAVIMAFAFSAFGSFAPAYAATGDITVNGAIKDATYTAYKVFDATSDGNAVSYTIPANSPLASQTGTAEFKAVFDTQSNGGVTYVTKNANASDEQVINYLKSQESLIATSAYQKATVTNSAGNASITLATGEQGYYYIKATVGTEQTGFKTAVTIDSAHPTATVNSKITDSPSIPTDGKKINGRTVNTMEVGETGNFTLTFNATNYAVHEDGTNEKITSYTVDDTMDGFNISDEQLNALTVKVGDATLTSTVSENAPYFTAQKTDNGLQVVIHNYDKGNYTSPSEVVISYQATLTDQHVVNESTNTFTAKYNTTDIPGTPESDTYNYKVVIDKYAAGNQSTKLSGAKFVLKDGNGTDAKFYKVGDNGVVSWVTDQTEATEVTTDSNGAASFQGLKAGTYYLVETQAPAGYNLLTEPTTVTLDDITAKQAKGSDNQIANLTQTAQVANNQGSTLPTTGGMGTTVLYALGAILVIGAGALLIARRKQLQK